MLIDICIWVSNIIVQDQNQKNKKKKQERAAEQRLETCIIVYHMIRSVIIHTRWDKYTSEFKWASY